MKVNVDGVEVQVTCIEMRRGDRKWDCRHAGCVIMVNGGPFRVFESQIQATRWVYDTIKRKYRAGWRLVLGNKEV